MTTPVAGSTGHYDASDADNLYEVDGPPPTTTPADGDAVQTWQDENAGNNIFTYGGGTSEPLYRATGMNSVGCLEFDGVDNRLGFFDSAISSLPLSDLISVSAYTVVFAFRLEGDGTNDINHWKDTALIADSGGYFGIVIDTDTGTDTISHFGWDGGANYESVNIAARSTDYVIQARYNGTTMYMSIDGGSEGAGTTMGNISDATNVVRMGCNYAAATFLPCKIGECFFYDIDLGASNNTYTYMREKWINEGGGTILPQIMHHRRLTEVS